MDAPFPGQRCHIVQTFNVQKLASRIWGPKCGQYLFGLSLAAALLDRLFEHPVGVFSYCATRADP